MTRWSACSATFTPHALKAVQSKILRSNYIPIHTTSNCPNTTYAAHQVVNSIEDLQNYQCFLLSPFHLASQPRVLIFVDNKTLATRITWFLDSLLPPLLQSQGIILHYHSSMSEKFLKQSHDAFTTSNGICQIMVTTSAQSVVYLFFIVLSCKLTSMQGVDFLNVRIVCTAGIPSTTTDTLQRSGRAFRNSDEDALFVTFYDPWVNDINLADYINFDQTDLDRPHGTLKPTSPCCERAPYYGVKLIQDELCLRKGYGVYLNDILLKVHNNNSSCRRCRFMETNHCYSLKSYDKVLLLFRLGKIWL